MGFPGANFPLHTFSKWSHSLLLLWFEMPSAYWQPQIYIFHPDFAPSLTHTLKWWPDICLQVFNSQPPKWPCVCPLSLTLGWIRERLWPIGYRKLTALALVFWAPLSNHVRNLIVTWHFMEKERGPATLVPQLSSGFSCPPKTPDMRLKPSWTPIPSCQMMGATGGTPMRTATKEPSSCSQSIHRTVAILCQ